MRSTASLEREVTAGENWAPEFFARLEASEPAIEATVATMSEHKHQIVEQFTQQAIPFSNAPALRDEMALGRLVTASGATPHDAVLDVACGPGLVVRAFAAVVARVTGIDLTPAMIERARQHTAGCANVELVCADVEHLPFADATFSIVVSRLAFHHFLHPANVLAEMKRVCKPGGRVVVLDVLGQRAHNLPPLTAAYVAA